MDGFLLSECEEETFIKLTNDKISSIENCDILASSIIRAEGRNILFKTKIGGRLWATFEHSDGCRPVITSLVIVTMKNSTLPLINLSKRVGGNTVIYEK
jgi:hypothetical protein